VVSSATVMWCSSADARTGLRACWVPMPRWCMRLARRMLILPLVSRRVAQAVVRLAVSAGRNGFGECAVGVAGGLSA
jgi:hypothetical protein